MMVIDADLCNLVQFYRTLSIPDFLSNLDQFGMNILHDCFSNLTR